MFYHDIDTESGHDSFLIDYDRYQGIVKNFLKNVSN